jgi:hypothetical protein
MSGPEQRIRILLANTTALGLPTQDLADLVQANMTGNILESVMRLRALTELSSQLDSGTLMALAAAVGRNGDIVADLMSALGGPKH